MSAVLRTPEIRVCPLKRLYQLIASENTHRWAAIISSSSQPDIRKLGSAAYVFRRYDDIDMEIPGRSFSREDADAFAGFLSAQAPKADVIYCCCDAGESRSPAVAAAVSRYFSVRDDHIWQNPHYHPNMLVFDRLTTALGVPVSDEEKDLLIYLNRKAFTDAINRAKK